MNAIANRDLQPSSHRPDAASARRAPRPDARSLEHLSRRGIHEGISFEQKCLAVLYVMAPESDVSAELEGMMPAVEWLATRHEGIVDRFQEADLLVFFDSPDACVAMAMNLQRSAASSRLRMGIHAGVWDVARFLSNGELGKTLLGVETREAARMANSAASGSIVISPQAYALVQADISASAHACLVTEEFEDSGFATASLTPCPLRGGPAASTFAGLGMV